MASPTTTRRFLLRRCVQLPQINSSSYYDGAVPDPVVVKEKIESAFSKVDSSILRGVLQFWAPVTSRRSGRRLLTTCNQPFSYNQHHDACVHKYESYRLNSQRYVYRIDNDMNDEEVERESLMMIISGPTANAFVTHLPEAIMDMSVEQLQVQVQGCPLMSSALECELKSYFVLPVFCDPCPTTSKPTLSSSSSSCVGVVECSMDPDFDYFKVFSKLKKALKRVGLRTFQVQESPTYKTIPGLKRSINEIEEALRFVSEAHDITAAQVWVPYKNDNYVPFNSSLEVTHAVKLTGYCVTLDDSLLNLIKSYIHTCDTLPLKMGDGLVCKTLQTYKSHFCTNINELSHNDINMLGLLSYTFRSSCFVICLRSIDTGDLDYAFEFLWPRSRNFLILLESLLLTLKKCLPSFRFAHGTEIGDEIRVLDVENSTGSGIGFFNILKGNGLSPMPKSLEERRLVAEDCMSSMLLPQEDVCQPLGRSMDEAAKNLSGWQRPSCVKRKLSDVYESESDSNEEDNRTNQDVLTLQVEYADDVFKFHLPISLDTIVAVKEEINKICKLNPGTYKIKYLDEDEEWILMNTDKHLRHFIRSWRTSNGTTNRLRVLPLTRLRDVKQGINKDGNRLVWCLNCAYFSTNYVKYLGEYGEDIPIAGAVAVCSPWDLLDVEFDAKSKSHGGTTSTKRSRAAEVHNLSERRRRDRINEKMKALQELIPCCNKSNKASMLDEAIKYLKSLQMQVQILFNSTMLFIRHKYNFLGLLKLARGAR